MHALMRAAALQQPRQPWPHVTRTHRRRCSRALRACAGASAAEADAEERLTAWCADAGVWQGASALAVARFPVPGGAYRGLRATRDVAAGELVASIPLSLCIHSQTDADWPHAGATATARLAARLLQEEAAGDSSRMLPWLDVLPRDMAQLGLFGAPAAVLAEASQQYAPILRLRAQTEASDAVAAAPTLAALGSAASAAALTWANVMVRTRAFELGHSAGGACILAFVPWLDMMNHAHQDAHLEWAWSPDSGCMEVVATRALRLGEEATISYGTRDNDGFLLWGGFVSEEANPADSVEAFDSLADVAAWWCDTGIGAALAGREESSLTAAQAAQLVAEVDAAARAEAAAAAAAGGEREPLKTAVCIGAGWQVDERLVDLLEALASREDGISAAMATRAAVAAVRLRAAQLLSAWPTSAEEDEQLLSAGGMTHHEALCVQFRAAKKRLLASYLLQGDD